MSPSTLRVSIPCGPAALALLSTFACKEAASVPSPQAPAAAQAATVAAAPPAVDLSGFRTAYDLIANRVHAVVHTDGRLVIAAGDPGFLKHVDGGWKSSWILGEKDGDRPVAFVSGLSSSLYFPLDVDGDGAAGKALADLKMAITMRAVPASQRVSVFVNEKPVGSFDVETARRSYDVAVPAAVLAKGENRLRLTFRSAGAIAGGKRSAASVERIEIGATAATGAGEGARAAEVDLGGRRRAISTAGPSRLSFYVQVPAGAKLALAYGAPSAGTTVAVRAAMDGAPAVTLFEGPASARWTEGAFDLGRFAGHAARIDLVSRGGGAAWAEPRLVVKGAATAASGKPKFDRIYIWMVDTLRADKVKVYNPKTVVETPHYDAFAKDATRFAYAHVPGTWSLPSHASILTGVYPTVHKATAHEAKLSRDVQFAAELMKKAGYRTALFSSNGYISGKWGFDRGWDEVRNFIRESLPNGAEYLWKTAKSWMFSPANKDKPQFVYLATVDPHVIYNPKKEFLERYWKKPYTGPIKPVMTGIQLGHIKSGKLKVNDTDKAYLEALHNAEITQSDAAFGAFIADLKAAGVYDSTVVIVVSDHGDEFWEHGDVGHAQSVHQELVHVPLIIRAPGAMPQGTVVQSDVEAMDVCPTVLELAGLTPPDDMQGQSLVALAHDEVPFGPGLALSQNMNVTRGLKVGRYRFIHSGARLQLYDSVKDPLEQKDLAADRPIALRKMRNVFGLLMAHETRWKKRRWGTASNVTEAFYAPGGS